MKKMIAMALLVAATLTVSVSAIARPHVIQGKHTTVVILNKDTHRKPMLCQHCADKRFRDARFARDARFMRDARFARFDRRDVRFCRKCDKFRCEYCGKKLTHYGHRR